MLSNLIIKKAINTVVLLCVCVSGSHNSRSECDPELFSHSAYVKFCVTFATKV